MASIGFLGVGTISEAMVRAMASRHGASDDFYLSPRSAVRTVVLADEFERCARLESNQAVIDASDLVVLGMRPQQVDSALAGLRFREDQVIASLIAGTPPSGIAPLVAPATRVCQLIPLPAITLRRGPLVISPPFPEVVTALQGLGEIVTLDDETQIRILSCASAFMSTYYEMQNRLIGWIAAQGIDEQTASRYVRAELDGLAAVGWATPDDQLAALPAEHQTKGGLNERVRAQLLETGWFDDLVGSIDDVYRTAQLRSSADDAP
jgi:pyrroline-5-carboxylate reductase